MKRYIVAGVLVFLVVLVTTFPARIAYNWFAPPEIVLTGIEGSIWSGAASEALTAGAYFRDLTWTLRPKALLSGKLAFDVAAKPADGKFAATIMLGINRSLDLINLTGSVPLDLVHQAFQQQGIRGDLSMDFTKLVIENDMPVEVAGNVIVTNFYEPSLSANTIGDFRVDFRSDNGIIRGTIDDLAGILDVDGEITLSPDRSYSVIGNVSAKPNAPPSIEQGLRLLGTADVHGFRPFRFEGAL